VVAYLQAPLTKPRPGGPDSRGRGPTGPDRRTRGGRRRATLSAATMNRRRRGRGYPSTPARLHWWRRRAA